MDHEKQTFSYRYSAQEQEEIQRIREKYNVQKETKLEKLRRLDASVTRPGTVLSLALGVVSILLLGTGMSCCMVWGGKWFIPGIIIGLLGIVGMAASYPLYDRITKKQREKLAPEILRLSEELMK